MGRQYRKTAFLIKFTDGTYDLAKRLPSIDSASTRDVPVVGEEEILYRPETISHHQDYLNYVDIGDSGSLAVSGNVIWVKAVKYLRRDAVISTFTLDGKPFIKFTIE